MRTASTRTRLLCSGLLGLSCVLAASAVGAAPLDLSNPMPRTIQVEFEISANPAVIAQSYSLAVAASYSATGNIGTVTIAAADYEAAIAANVLDDFDVVATRTLVGGSPSAFQLDIDLSTHEASAQPASYQLLFEGPPFPFPQIGTVTRTLGTTTLAGFAFNPAIPGFAFFCDTCTLVPGAPYDPLTGEINAVGSDALDAPDLALLGFSRAGDLRLSEVPAVPALGPLGPLARVGAGLALVLLTATAALRGTRRARVGSH